MVDTLVSGASASRRVGSTPIMGTKKAQLFKLGFFCLCPNGMERSRLKDHARTAFAKRR